MLLTSSAVVDCLSNYFEISELTNLTKRQLQLPLQSIQSQVTEKVVCVSTIEEVDDFTGMLKNSLLVLVKNKPNKNWILNCLQAHDVDLIYIEHATAADVYATLTNIFLRFSEYFNQLYGAELTYSGLQQMVNVSAELMGGTIRFVDSMWRDAVVSQHHNLDSSLLFTDSKSKIRNLQDLATVDYNSIKGLFVYPEHEKKNQILCLNINYESGEYAGRLLYYPENQGFTETQRFVFKKLGEHIEYAFSYMPPVSMLSSSFDDLRLMVRNDIIKREHDEPLARETFLRLPWNYDSKFLLVKIKPITPGVKIPSMHVLIYNLEKLWKNVCGVALKDSAVFLFSIKNPADEIVDIMTQEFLVFLRDSLHQAGISEIYSGFQNTLLAYDQASAALEIGSKIDPTFWSYKFKDYRMEFVYEQIANSLKPDAFIHPALKRIKESDELTNSNYYHILLTYLEYNCNATQSAKALGIHRTTLIDKINRIQDIGDVDLKDVENRIALLLSYRVDGK